ncbi:MAG: response regulator transcription factor [Solirubrobacterales bacterium]
MRVLVVEDEKTLSGALAHMLKKAGYGADVASDGQIGYEMAETGVYDLIILDRMLPKRDGISLLKEIRQEGIETPVLLLTAKDSTEDRVEGLDAGADDYMVKPFSGEELMARLRALTRRMDKPISANLLEANGIVLDPVRREVACEGRIVHLTHKEVLLLELLMRNQGLVVSKQTILEKIWGYESEIDLSNVDLYIHYLRKKLKTNLIKNVRGIGYYMALKKGER